MNRILVTAFEPFGGKSVNASAAVLSLLPGEIAGCRVEKLLLPVVFGQAAEKALAVPADCIFLLGEAGGWETVTPEVLARNLREGRLPDNAGNRPPAEKIDPEGPEEYRTVFPVEEITERMRAEEAAVRVSGDAGRFVCNETFYLVGTGSRVPVDFIHVPGEAEQAGAYAATVLRYMELCLESRGRKTE